MEHTSLESFAKSSPTLGTLREMANRLALEYLNCTDLSLDRLKAGDERDEVFENSKLTLKYLTLYEELSWAMNYGDVGHVERCLVAWIPLFKGSSKHKYATHLKIFLMSVHFDLPVAAHCAVRYNWLLNVTSRPGKFHAVDWCVELHNLEIKVRQCTQEHQILTSIG